MPAAAEVDPDVAMWELRALLAAYSTPGAGHRPQEQADRADRITELIEDLDHWLCGGGRLPAPWRKARPRA
jgi:hypothetical protein